ncbi:MAG: C1 family peptidase [Saprospiraceae bacterium]
MPIRMEQDPQHEGGNNRPSGPRNNQGGGGSLLKKALPFLIMFLIKRPKLILPVLVIGGLWYFFFGGQAMLSGGSAEDSLQNADFSLGASLSEEMFDKAQVFEPLTYGYGGSGLPQAYSLEQYAPRRLHQGQQGSCVGWASAYGARTILQARATGQNPNQTAFSPAYLYNQIHLEGCQGAYMLDAMKAMAQNGGVPFNDFQYTDQSCSSQPNSGLIAKGQQFRIKGYNRLTLGANNYKVDIDGIKQNLAQGAPVVIGMMVGGTFMSRMVGQDTWIPDQRDYSMRGFGGHAMCVIGYDDNREGGAFQIMNSWGEDWGNRGIFWMRYRDFEQFTKEAYGLHPMGSTEQYNPNKLEVQFGLADLATQSTIALKQTSDIEFRTAQPIKKGDKFKILVANSIECYVYVFGQETDASSYVLFPYTEKHSAYCGITGTRLFPRDYSMKADEIGNTDYIAVVVSKKEIDFDQFNRRISQSRQSTYAAKLKEALANERIANVKFEAGKTVGFTAETEGKNMVGMVIALDKQ